MGHKARLIMNNLTDFQSSILYLILLAFVCLIYKFELSNKDKKDSLINNEQYKSKSYITSVFLIILFALLFIIYFFKAIF